MATVKVFVHAANADADANADISSPDIYPGLLKMKFLHTSLYFDFLSTTFKSFA